MTALTDVGSLWSDDGARPREPNPSDVSHLPRRRPKALQVQLAVGWLLAQSRACNPTPVESATFACFGIYYRDPNRVVDRARGVVGFERFRVILSDDVDLVVLGTPGRSQTFH